MQITGIQIDLPEKKFMCKLLVLKMTPSVGYIG